MEPQTAHAHAEILYEPDERPPLALGLGLAFQYALLIVAGVVLTPVIMIRAAGGGEAYLSWAVFTAMVICGLTTVIQATRLGRIGAGYILIMGSSSAFLAVCVSALEQGGPGLLAILIILTSLCQFTIAAKLSLFRRIFTPTVAGTVLMLIPITIAPIILGKMAEVPAGASAAAAPVSAGVTLVVMVAIVLRSSGAWRLWAPIIGVAAGSLTGGLVFGIYDTTRILEAAWIGLPAVAWPGLDLSFGPTFWALLPAFVFVTLIGALDTIGDAISIQGALNADGLGNLLSGLTGTVPNTTYASSISVAELTGVTARWVGACVGVIFIVLAFLPKAVAVVMAIPNPVVAAYFIVVMAILFIMGMRILFQDGLDYRKGFVVGLAFWLGVAFQLDWIFPEYFQGALSELFGNAMTVGGLSVIVLMLFVDLTRARRGRIRLVLNAAAAPHLDTFLSDFATRPSWDGEMNTRLRAVGEETLLTLIRRDQDGGAERHLLLIVRADYDAAELEFIAATDETNLEDQVALLGDHAAGVPAEEELSLRLLRYYASSVRHQQYHDTDLITVRVEPPIPS